jgi:hypothetical protein
MFPTGHRDLDITSKSNRYQQKTSSLSHANDICELCMIFILRSLKLLICDGILLLGMAQSSALIHPLLNGERKNHSITIAALRLLQVVARHQVNLEVGFKQVFTRVVIIVMA